MCYWPNLGYGRFGPKVTMDGAPRFDRPELFDARRMRLADIDGSGTADIIYFAAGAFSLFFNQSGNAVGAPHVLGQFPSVDSVSTAIGARPSRQRHGLSGVVVATDRQMRAVQCATST